MGCQLPQALELRLAAQVIAAHTALEICSSLSVLNRDCDLHDQVAGLLERTTGDRYEAFKAIRALPEDDVVARLVVWIEEIDQRVKGEWDDDLVAGKIRRERRGQGAWVMGLKSSIHWTIP